MWEPDWITDTLKEHNFIRYNTYVMKRDEDSAHIGGDRNGWCVAVYIGDASSVCYTEKHLREFLKPLRQKKLERIIGYGICEKSIDVTGNFCS